MTKLPLPPSLHPLLWAAGRIENFERDGVRFSVTTTFPFECVFCGAGLDLDDACWCTGAVDHRNSRYADSRGEP